MRELEKKTLVWKSRSALRSVLFEVFQPFNRTQADQRVTGDAEIEGEVCGNEWRNFLQKCLFRWWCQRRCSSPPWKWVGCKELIRTQTKDGLSRRNIWMFDQKINKKNQNKLLNGLNKTVLYRCENKVNLLHVLNLSPENSLQVKTCVFALFELMSRSFQISFHFYI